MSLEGSSKALGRRGKKDAERRENTKVFKHLRSTQKHQETVKEQVDEAVDCSRWGRDSGVIFVSRTTGRL